MRLTLVILWLVASVAVAEAYPQFQLSLDGQCGTCHLSPAGGGLISAYGRDEAGNTISRGGDGRLLHGAWDAPDWLAIGGDYRFAAGGRRMIVQRAGVEDVQTQRLVFPMQADIYLRAMKGGFAFALTAGLRGQSQEAHRPAFVESLVSREHYAAYAWEAHQVRAGRFFPVFGLRLHDHTAFVRRHMGWNLLEEPYALEYAHYGEKTELHVAAFTPPPVPILATGLQPTGVTAHVERRVSERAIAGAQARVGIGPLESRYTVGAIGKWWMPDAGLLWLAEFDVQRQTFNEGGPGRTQLASYLGVSKWATRGVLVSGAVHTWEPDLALVRTLRQAFEVNVQYFAWAHVELHLLLRASAQGGSVEDPTYLSLLQFHYYL
jgi:hypothetical protein